MAPVRRTRTSTVTDVYPPTPPSAGDEDSDEYNPSSAEIEGRTGNNTKENSHWTVSFPSDPNTTQRTRVGSIMSTATPLQRGFACRSCRKRKLKCSGEKPVCEQCVKQNRAADCEYDDGRNRTRTQLLQEKIHRLEARIHELESSTGASSRATLAESAYPQAPNPLIHGSQGQSFDMSAPQDHRASNDNAFDFGSGTSPSAILSYEQLQLRETLNAVTGGKVPSEQHGPSPGWQQDVLPAHVQQQLLDIILPHLASLGVDVNPQHFLQSLNLPSTHARRPHPSLLNALFLHACALSPPDHYLHPHQHRFLRSAVQAIAYSLEFADRLIDTLRAQCLVALWYIRAGRTLEAYNMISTAARFAVACELNRIVSPIFKPSPPSSEVGMDSNPSSPLHGIGIGIPRLAAIAATPATISGEPIALDGEGKIDAYRPITTGNFTHPRSISLGFGTGILPAWSFVCVSSPPQGPDALSASFNPSPRRPISQSKPNPVLDPPKNTREVGERILLFWRIFDLDRFWSVVCGLQPSLSEDEITTVWPRPLEDYEMGNVNDAEYASVRTLGIKQPTSTMARPDSLNALLSKSITLFERSSRLGASLSAVQTPTEAFWIAFRLMEDSIIQLSATTPPYMQRVVFRSRRDSSLAATTASGGGSRSQAGSGSHRPSPAGSVHGDSPVTPQGSTSSSFSFGQLGVLHQIPTPPYATATTGFTFPHPHVAGKASSSVAGPTDIMIDNTLVLVHILLHCASIQLYNIFAKDNPTCYQKALASAHTGARIIAEVSEVIQDPNEYNLMLGPCLTLIADVLIREGNRGLSGGGGGMMIESIEPELEAVLFALRMIGAGSPLVRRQAALVVAARDALFGSMEGQDPQGFQLQPPPQIQQQQQQQQLENTALELDSVLSTTMMLPFGMGSV